MRIAVAMGVLGTLSVSVVTARDSRNIPLRLKAEQFEQDVLRKHWSNGLYMPGLSAQRKVKQETKPRKAARMWRTASTGRVTTCRAQNGAAAFRLRSPFSQAKACGYINNEDWQTTSSSPGVSARRGRGSCRAQNGAAAFRLRSPFSQAKACGYVGFFAG